MRTLEEQLESVQKAIDVIEGGGQEIDVEVNQNRRKVSRADLKELYKRETQLKMAIKRKNGGGIYRSVW